MKKIYLMLIAGCITTMSMANNITLANVSLSGQNTTSMFSLVNFDVSWENSWRTITNEANYDGAWIFVKFRKTSSTTWQHATISLTGSTTPANSVIQTSLDGKGVWMYRALPGADFTGNVNYTGAKIQWNYGVDGVLNTDNVEIRVFAVEMVYVTGGTYKLGSGGTETAAFLEGSKTTPFNVLSESSLTVANTAGNLYYAAAGGDQGGPIPAAFPKGFSAFWLMKYEASQQQYVDFLNNIDLAKATNRNPGGATITGVHPALVAQFPERAMGSLSINDNLAFTDWACLRPYTELEYEKACRGYNQVATNNEYPWGSTTIAATTATTNTGFDNEIANNGNANYTSGLGRPTRNGIYATATSDRQQSGGTYYGIMDMAGNLFETTITVGAPEGRSFTKVNGDGNLDVNGLANALTWPIVTAGFSLRGGGYGDAAAQLRTSDRIYGVNPLFAPVTRGATLGLRSARTAE